MKEPGKLIGNTCLLVMLATTVWNCGATAVALRIWFQPVPPDLMKLDAMTEIWLISGILNESLPFFLVSLVGAIVLTVRRGISVMVVMLTALVFAASLAPAVVLWNELVRMHGSEINLWKNHIWWYIG